HLLVEAADRHALTRRMQSFAINAARAINSTDGRRGKVFAYRYHATQVRTPRQARCTLAYVLNNWRHHREDMVLARAFEAAVDPYSSGLSFTGWKGRRFRVPEGYTPLPVSPPATPLLRYRWTPFGRIVKTAWGESRTPGPYPRSPAPAARPGLSPRSPPLPSW